MLGQIRFHSGMPSVSFRYFWPLLSSLPFNIMQPPEVMSVYQSSVLNEGDQLRTFESSKCSWATYQECHRL